ncbi:MAG: hypothetical protein ABI045_04225 [Flavobacteriales bacterium]
MDQLPLNTPILKVIIPFFTLPFNKAYDPNKNLKHDFYGNSNQFKYNAEKTIQVFEQSTS